MQIALKRNCPGMSMPRLALPLLLFLAWSTSSAALLKVGDGESIRSVAQALVEANDGDTVLITSGRYCESGLSVDKAISIIGEGWPVIDGTGLGQIFHVTASNVVITGIIVRGAPVSFVEDNAGILLEGVKNCIVEGNRFENNFFAVYVAKSTDCIVRNNTIRSVKSTETRSGNGIHLWYCRNISVTDNSINGHRDGIYFEFVRNSTIIRNNSHENLRYGLHFMFSDSCLYEDNAFVANGAGVAVMYTHYVQMIGNRFEHNWGPSSFGLLLKEISDSEVRDNVFIRNSIGMYLEGCNRIQVDANTFNDNGWGVQLMANSMDNRFVRNNFIGNSFAVATNSRQNFNFFENNYWTGYDGYDLDRDGFGDTSYRPVSLLSMIVQKNPPTLVLMHSLTVQLLDLVERFLPGLTPATLADNRPAMEPYP